jgi:hypothetical protein
MTILKWIFLAGRPLAVEELRQALAIVPGDAQLEHNRLCLAKFIVEYYLGLVTSTMRALPFVLCTSPYKNISRISVKLYFWMAKGLSQRPI